MHSWILSILIFYLNLNLLKASDEAYNNRARGVPPQLISFYQENSGNEFECLDGSLKIPFSRVNDDYCDCADGSDEPGTSACPNGSFYCRNFGFSPVTLPSSRVNDRICDCCDGSDEYYSDVKCPNICEKLGESARQNAEKLQKLHEVGYKKRIELAKEAEKLLEEKRRLILEKKKEIDEIHPIKEELETAKIEAEKLETEALDAFNKKINAQKEEETKNLSNELLKKVDIDNDGRITIIELKNFFTNLDEEKIKEFLGDVSELTIESLPNYLDKFKIYLKENGEIRSTDDDLTNKEELESKDLNDELEEEKQKNPEYDEATKSLVDRAELLRKEHNEISRKISSLENEISEIDKLLQLKTGDDHAWALLNGQCAEHVTNQYIYKVCLFDRTIQKDKNGYSEVALGYWEDWAGPDNNIYSAQKYTRGQSCWNGPERSTFVEIECGEELQLVEVTEPAKCEYRFKLLSPTACLNPINFDKHIEL